MMDAFAILWLIVIGFVGYSLVDFVVFMIDGEGIH